MINYAAQCVSLKWRARLQTKCPTMEADSLATTQLPEARSPQSRNLYFSTSPTKALPLPIEQEVQESCACTSTRGARNAICPGCSVRTTEAIGQSARIGTRRPPVPPPPYRFSRQTKLTYVRPAIVEQNIPVRANVPLDSAGKMQIRQLW